MVADFTPDQWLSWLTQRMDARSSHLRVLRDRMEGCGPLPEVSDSVREAYRDFQRKARTNWAGLIVDAVAERMVISGVRVGDDPGDDDQARKILTRNRVSILGPDVHRDMLGLRCGYLSLTGGDQGAVISYERPEQVITEQDPIDPWRTRAGLKLWRDRVAGWDYAVVSVADGTMWRWRRPCISDPNLRTTPSIRASGNWQPLDFVSGLSPWSIFQPIENAGGVAEFEQHADLLDRIDYGILQRLVITAMQAYRQRALQTEDGKSLPETDEAGNVIDYGALFRPGAGALWELPPGVKLWESQSTDITPLLTAHKDDLRDLAAVSRTPLTVFIPDGVNQTAEGAARAYDGLISKTENRIERAKASWDLIVSRALAIEAKTADLPEVSVSFKPAAVLSLSERADAATKAANDLPWRTRVTDIWGYDGDTADRMEAERSQDALVLGLSQLPPTPAAPPTPPAGPSVA